VNEILPGCEDWTEINLYSKILPIVAIVSGAIFLGPDLCRREEYVHSSINYTVDLFTAIPKLKLWNPWLRPIGKYWVKELKSVEEHRSKAKEFLRPVIAERRQMAKDGKALPDDMLQWMLNKCQDFGLTDEDMAILQLNLSLAAIHTTSLTTVFL
jgi:cytochrome P450